MKRNYNLDLIRIAVCVAILVLHIFGVEGGYINTVLYYLGIFGIPLFFMVSGYNMLAKKRSYHEILLKVVNIYLFLIILCVTYGLIYAFLKKKNISVVFDIFIDIFSNKGNLGILWFMVALSIIYLITPILYNFRDNRKIVFSLVVISLLIFIANIFLKKYCDVIIKDIIVQPLRLWTWITYYLLGYNIRNREKQKMDSKIKDNSTNDFNPLCAQPLGYDPEIYKSALKFALEDDDIKNIAISGAYCSGKSTIWNTYLKEESTEIGDVITVQLGKYADYHSYSNSNLVNQQNKQNTSSENEIENRVERQIINQILAQVKPNKIPLYEHKYKQNKKCLDFCLGIIFSVLLSICIFFWNDYKIVYIVLCKLKISLSLWILSRISLFIILIWIIYYLMKKGLIKISKISFKGAEATVNQWDSDETVLDRENKDLVYLLNSSEARIVVFEDLDRFDNIKLFNKLKELNFLLNSYRKMGGNLKPVRFIYMVKDSTFTSENRVKFFDFIIPVVPVINEYNSIDYLYEEMSKIGINIKDFDEKLLIKLALYLNDMRILKNILNEFIIYKNRLNYDDFELNDNKILALMVFKNLSPKEYELLCTGQGFVYKFLNNPQELKDDINNWVQKTNQEAINVKNNGLTELFKVVTSSDFKRYYREGIISNSDLSESFIGLIDYLIKVGYLDRTYYYYIGNFKVGQNTFCHNDRMFIKNMLEQEKILINLIIESPGKVNTYFNDSDFENKHILNSTLLAYLVENYGFPNDEYAKRIQLMFKVLVEYEEIAQSSLLLKLVQELDDRLLRRLINLLDPFDLIKILEYCPEKNCETYLRMSLIFLSTNEILFPTDNFKKLAESLDSNLDLISGLNKKSFEIFLKNIINFDAKYNLYTNTIANEDMLKRMINAGRYIEDINNLHFIMQYLSRKKIDITDLIHEFYNNSQLVDIWDNAVKKNPELPFQYIEEIPENTKINLQDDLLQKILISSNTTELKNKFINHSDSKILNLEDVMNIPDFNDILPNLVDFNLVEMNGRNLRILWENNSVTQELFMKYLEENSSNSNLRELLSQNVDICNILIQWDCSDIIYNIASEIADKKISEINEVLKRTRIKDLITRNLIELNNINIDFLIQHKFNQELYLLSKNRENEFIDIIIGYNLKISYEQFFFLVGKISKENLIKLVNNVEGYESTTFNINNRKIKYILSLDEIILSFRIGILEKILEKQVNIQSIVEYLKAFPEAGQLASVFNNKRPSLNSDPKIEIAKILEKHGYISIKNNKVYMIKKKFL